MRSTSLQLFNTLVQIDNYNDDFLLLRSEDNEQLTLIGNAIYQNNFDFIDEVIVTEAEVCLKLNEHFETSKLDLFSDLESVAEVLTKTIRLPVYFGAQGDWQRVIDHTGLEKEEIIRQLIQTEFSLAMFGFLPGFLYLRGLPENLQVPRKSVPSKYIEAGAIAIGGQYLGCYALDSPGGWQVIGRTPLKILQLPDLPPLPLRPGDNIRIEAIDQSTYQKLLSQSLTLNDYNA